MNRYPAYKHTGVNIISEIPSQWELNKFNHIAFYQEGPGLRNWQFTEMGVSVICVTNITTHGIDFSLLKDAFLRKNITGHTFILQFKRVTFC